MRPTPSKFRFAAVGAIAAALSVVTILPASARPKAAAVTTATTTTVAPTSSGYTHTFTESFNSTTWYTAWGMTKPGRADVVTEAGNNLYRVVFWQGTHGGTSFFKSTGDADAVHLRYRLRFSSNWDASKAGGDVKLPGLGRPVLDSAGVCLVACGGSPADGLTGWSARTDVYADNGPGFYVYDADMPTTLPAYGKGWRWFQSPFVPDRWYTIDEYVTMNTPGQHDGVLRSFVDGVKVFEKTDFNFRNVSTLHAGNAWFDFYYGGGGLSPVTQWVDVDDILVEW